MESGQTQDPVPESTGEETDNTAQHEAEPCEFLDHVPSIIELDKRGDRELVVGTNKCSIDSDGIHEHKSVMRFRVCSKALARSSPVLEAMLFGQFTEANQEVVKLPDDDPWAMQLLLHISHGNSTPVYKVAQKQSTSQPNPAIVDEIYAIVSLADKYLMTQHLRPWVFIWTNLLLKRAISSGFERLEKSLFVASVFGHIRLYQWVAADLVWFQQHPQRLFSNSIAPDGAKVLIRRRRIDHIVSMLQILENTVEGLTMQPDPIERLPDERQSHAYALGTIIQNLKREGLWPIPELAEEVKESPHAFREKLKSTMWNNYHPNHPDCTLKKKVDQLLEARGWSVNNELPDSIKNPLLPRAEAFGLPPNA